MDADLLRELSEDRALASVVLFEHRHPQREAPMHVEIMDVFASADEFIVVEAFREAGKTTKGEEHLILGGCFGNFHYCLLLGETYEKACQRLDAINHECTTNDKLAEIFGGPALRRKSIENKLWFRSGAFIQALGWEQELQSFKYQTHRPDLAYLDDPENDERVRDKESVDASMRKLFNDLIPAMDKERRKIILSQTRKAEDCMVTRLAANPRWLYRGYPIADRDPDDPEALPTWPARYPMAWIREEKRSFQASGMLSSFLQMYMLQTVDPEAKPFKDSMLASLDVSPYHWMPRYVLYDPSRTSNQRRSDRTSSDRTGKVVVSRLGSKILVHESGAHYWKPDAFINDVFATFERHAPAKIGVEKTSLDDWLLQPIQMETLRRGVSLPLKPLNAPQDRSKEEFIQGLLPFATAKDIVLVGGRTAHPQLVAEWANFPQGPRDIMNALAYSLRIFAGVPMYEDFNGGNILEAPAPRLGEAVYFGFQASGSEVATVAVIRDGRRLCVAQDAAGTGAIADVVKTLVFGLRAAFPGATFQAWIPAETFDQAQRIALVPALRGQRLTPYRGEHVAVARGCLSEYLRTKWHNKPMLTVDNRSKGVLNALSAGYALSVEKGRPSSEPEPGTSRLIAEALECVVSALHRIGESDDQGLPRGANLGYNPAGLPYISANPRARA